MLTLFCLFFREASFVIYEIISQVFFFQFVDKNIIDKEMKKKNQFINYQQKHSIKSIFLSDKFYEFMNLCI